MKDKKWYKSKTIWSGIALVGIGVCNAFGIDLPYEIVYSLAGAFGLYGVRDAISNGKKK